MSRTPTPRKFDSHKPLEVRIWFRWAGRDYEPGQPFKWKSNGIDQRRVRQMFDQGKLKFAEASTPEAVLTVPEVALVTPKSEKASEPDEFHFDMTDEEPVADAPTKKTPVKTNKKPPSARKGKSG